MATPSTLIKDFYIGKNAVGFEFGQNEGEGSRQITLPQLILDAVLIFDGEDVGVQIKLENGQETFLYDNEELYTA